MCGEVANSTGREICFPFAHFLTRNKDLALFILLTPKVKKAFLFRFCGAEASWTFS